MPDPIPRNRSARNRRQRRLMRPRSWRGGPFRRARDNTDEAEPLVLHCTIEGPPLHLDQPLRRTRPPPARRTRRRTQRVRPIRARAGGAHRVRPRRASADAAVGVSILAGVALVMGLTLPLLPTGISTGSAAAPAVGDHADGAAPPPDRQDPGPVAGVPAAQPGAVVGVDRHATREQVTLLADRTRPTSQAPANQPSPAVVPSSPVQPAGATDLGRQVSPLTTSQGLSNAVPPPTGSGSSGLLVRVRNSTTLSGSRRSSRSSESAAAGPTEAATPAVPNQAEATRAVPLAAAITPAAVTRAVTPATTTQAAVRPA
jgi:hypothetical protein